jgi:nucleotide-binding universal stress UspA family protein
MALYTRILVPIDGSAIDQGLLEHVAQIARLTGAEVVLLRVAHYHTRDTMAHEVEEAEELLAGAAAELAGKEVKVRTLVGRGEVADEIVAQAESLHADLIVMATHGHGLVARTVLGSVAEDVRHHTSVPLLLLKGQHEEATPGERQGG